MKKIVLITNKTTGKQVGCITVVLSSITDELTEQEFIDEGWRSAVDEGIVKDSEREAFELLVKQ